MQSVHSQAIIGDKDEQNAGVWADEGHTVYAPRIVWVDLCWGDKTVVVALPVACVVCMASGAVARVVPEVFPLNQRGALRWLPGPRRLCPY